MSVNIPDIHRSEGSISFQIADDHLHHISGLHMGPDPVLMGLSGKKLLIDKIFTHGIAVTPCHDTVRILIGHEAQTDPSLRIPVVLRNCFRGFIFQSFIVCCYCLHCDLLTVCKHYTAR